MPDEDTLKFDKVCDEFLETERSYVEGLETLVSVYHVPLMSFQAAEGKTSFTPEHAGLLFGNICQIHDLHNQFLLACQGMGGGEKLVSEFLNLVPGLSKYIEYCVGFEAAAELQQRLVAEHQDLQVFFQGVHPLQPLSSYLITPVQRIPRYRLLLAELLKCCPATMQGVAANLKLALKQVSALALQINEEIRERQNQAELTALSLQFSEDPKLTKKGRFLIKREDLAKRCRSGTKVFHFLLFNDLLVYASTLPLSTVSKYKLHRKIPIDGSFELSRRLELAPVAPPPPSRAKLQRKTKPDVPVETLSLLSPQKSFVIEFTSPEKRIEWRDAFTMCIAKAKVPRNSVTSISPAALMKPKAAAMFCGSCKSKFSLFKPAKHCRVCGDLFCNNCTRSRVPLFRLKRGADEEDSQKLKRVCDSCATSMASNGQRGKEKMAKQQPRGAVTPSVARRPSPVRDQRSESAPPALTSVGLFTSTSPDTPCSSSASSQSTPSSVLSPSNQADIPCTALTISVTPPPLSPHNSTVNDEQGTLALFSDTSNDASLDCFRTDFGDFFLSASTTSSKPFSCLQIETIENEIEIAQPVLVQDYAFAANAQHPVSMPVAVARHPKPPVEKLSVPLNEENNASVTKNLKFDFETEEDTTSNQRLVRKSVAAIEHVSKPIAQPQLPKSKQPVTPRQPPPIKQPVTPRQPPPIKQPVTPRQPPPAKQPVTPRQPPAREPLTPRLPLTPRPPSISKTSVTPKPPIGGRPPLVPKAAVATSNIEAETEVPAMESKKPLLKPTRAPPPLPSGRSAPKVNLEPTSKPLLHLSRKPPCAPRREPPPPPSRANSLRKIEDSKASSHEANLGEKMHLQRSTSSGALVEEKKVEIKQVPGKLQIRTELKLPPSTDHVKTGSVASRALGSSARSGTLPKPASASTLVVAQNKTLPRFHSPSKEVSRSPSKGISHSPLVLNKIAHSKSPIFSKGVPLRSNSKSPYNSKSFPASPFLSQLQMKNPSRKSSVSSSKSPHVSPNKRSYKSPFKPKSDNASRSPFLPTKLSSSSPKLAGDVQQRNSTFPIYSHSKLSHRKSQTLPRSADLSARSPLVSVLLDAISSANQAGMLQHRSPLVPALMSPGYGSPLLPTLLAVPSARSPLMPRMSSPNNFTLQVNGSLLPSLVQVPLPKLSGNDPSSVPVLDRKFSRCENRAPSPQLSLPNVAGKFVAQRIVGFSTRDVPSTRQIMTPTKLLPKATKTASVSRFR